MAFALVFPGQGSQSVGMLTDLAARHPVVIDTFAEASEILGFDLWKLVHEGPEEELGRTVITQPAMLAAGVSVWRVWTELGGPAPDCVAGHSLGEYSALVCADVLAFRDAVSLVSNRARLMQEAVPEGQGAMAAVLGLDDDQVRAVCDEAAQGAVVSAVNFNAPGQVVIAGQSAAVDRAVDAAKIAGAKRAIRLPVSVPSHCALMLPAAEKLAGIMAGIPFQTAAVPVLHNVNATESGDSESVRDLLARQLYSPVLWVDTLNQIAQRGVDTVIECGPGKVLNGLTKRINKQLNNLAAFDESTIAAAIAAAKGE